MYGCQLNDAKNKHGIVFLENRSKKLIVNSSNINDAINIIGQPHSKGAKNKLDWIYIERVFEKGKFYKLGQNVLRENNVLVLTFDKYGILKTKRFFTKEDLNKLTFQIKLPKMILLKKVL